MKFDCGEDWKHQKARLSKWHDHFLWFPKQMGNHDCRWLETIERKGTRKETWDDNYWLWEYRVKEDKTS